MFPSLVSYEKGSASQSAAAVAFIGYALINNLKGLPVITRMDLGFQPKRHTTFRSLPFQ